MARIYSRRKGKSGSKKPENPEEQSWLRYSAPEAELLIAKLAKEGKTPSLIGLTLRDSYGIPSAKILLNKKITALLDEKKLLSNIPEDLSALMKRLVLIKKHLEKHPHDMTSVRGDVITNSKIKRLVKYYKQTGKLPVDWKYDLARVRLLVE